MSCFPPGTTLAGRYLIGAELGRGGHSVVYRARDLSLGADIAVKLLVPPPATQELARERLRREVLAVRALSHPHIVPVYDCLTEGPWQFVLMQLVEGEDLERRVSGTGPLAPGAAVALGRAIAAALTQAHGAGVLHRDVKPRNILLDREGKALLTDFGSARILSQATMTETGGLVGTLGYAAPELMTGARADARADVYALGLTLYYALVGRLPAQAASHLPPAPREEGFHPAAERREVPAWLDAAIACATRSDPATRFPTAAALAEALGDPSPGVTAPTLTPEDRCLVCGDLDVEGLTVCRRCGGTGHRTDALIFLEPGAAVDRDDRLAQLLAWFGGSSGAGHRDVVQGLKPLTRVPDGMVGPALDRLAARGLPARAVPVASAWRMIPVGLWVLAALVLGLGLYASAVLDPLLRWTSPAVAVLLLTGAWGAGRRPLIGRTARGARFEPALERELVATAAELPAGPARELLGGTIRLGRHLIDRVDGADRQALIAETLPVAAAGARELVRLDDALAVLERTPGAVADAGARGQLERHRDRLVQHFLELQGGLARLVALPAPDADRAADFREALGALERELAAVA